MCVQVWACLIDSMKYACDCASVQYENLICIFYAHASKQFNLLHPCFSFEAAALIVFIEWNLYGK